MLRAKARERSAKGLLLGAKILDNPQMWILCGYIEAYIYIYMYICTRNLCVVCDDSVSGGPE